jgi:hypothetical protein
MGAVIALTLVAAAVAVYRVAGASPSCEIGRPDVEIVASPDIAPAVEAVVRDAEDLRVPASCPRVRVHAETETGVLAALTRTDGRPPDVWIPSSSLWVEHARAVRPVEATEHGSIASSPLVLALPRAVAEGLPADDGGLEWDDLVRAVSAGSVVFQLADPETSPATTGLLLALDTFAETAPGGRAALTGVLLSAQTVTGPASGLEAVSLLDSSPNGAVPVPEQAVWAHQGRDGAVPVVAAYSGSAGTPFDYPFVVLGTDRRVAATAERVLAALRGAAGQDRLRAAGFRGTDGNGAGLTEARGVDGSRPSTAAVPTSADVERMRYILDAVHRDARLLAVLDVSGSMAGPAFGQESATRLDVATRAAAAGLALYPDTAQVGLWSFSQDLTATTDYQELVPLSPLTGSTAGGRNAVAQAVTGLQPVPGGGTALYDTTLAAVRAVRATFDPTRVNAVVLFSDGEDTDDNGIGLDALLATLRAEAAPGQPVPVFTIAYGPDSGAGALAAISEATGGLSHRTTDENRIRQVFLDAIGQRLCQPACAPTSGG